MSLHGQEYLSDEERRKEAERFQTQRIAEKIWRSFGNLTENEIKELAAYEFRRAPHTLRKQLRRYRLLLKVEKPEHADAMWNELSNLDYRNPTVAVVVRCCYILHRYGNRSSLCFEGKTYTKTSSDQQPI